MCNNYNTIEQQGQVPIKAWTKGVPFEDAAIAQLNNIAQMSLVHSHIAVMPDVHMGKGATIGSVIPSVDAVIPAAVRGKVVLDLCTRPVGPTSCWYMNPPLSMFEESRTYLMAASTTSFGTWIPAFLAALNAIT